LQENRGKSAVAVVLLRNADHGKEGVDGSSPSEPFRKPPQMSGFFSVRVAGSDDRR